MSSVEEYTILVRTGERLLTASDLRLSVTILGKQANQTAGPFSLHSKGSLIERHHGDSTEVHSGFDATKDIGDIIAIRLQSKSGWRPVLNSIYINHIRVRQPSRGQDCFFPVYSWINANETRIFFCGPAQLPNSSNVSAYMKTLRGSDLAYWQSVYDSTKLVRMPNLPVGMAARYCDLPSDEQFLSIKARQIFTAILQDIADTAVANVIGKTKSWDSYDEMKMQFFKNGRLPTPIAEVWEQDTTMGRSFVSGLNPYLMKLCKDVLPEGFPISKEDINANVSLFHSRSIDADLKRGYFCYLDFRPLLEDLVELQNQYRLGIKKRPGSDRGFLLNTLSRVLGTTKPDDLDSRYLAAPVCVLYWNDDLKSLVPVAIQLKRDGKIYYAADETSTEEVQNEWQLAKMWVCSADTQVHQLRTHFFRTHMITECFALAMRRSLSPAHPLYRLLKPHLQNVMAMNALARQRLLPLICKLFALGDETFAFVEKCFELWSFDVMCPKTELKMNGFEDNTDSPLVKEAGAYPWREDVLEIWHAIEEYVTGFISIYYLPGHADKETTKASGQSSSSEKSGGGGSSRQIPSKKELEARNDLVMNDTELDHFRLELLDLLPGKTFPEFESVHDVIQLMTRVIYTASAGHSAINFNQYEHYAWQPHHPMIMRLPIPEEINEPITERVILDSIPNITQTVQAVAISRALSEYSPDEVYLGKLSDQDLLHSDPQARVIFDTFNHRLDEVTSKIRERNATGIRKKNPYVYLLPSMIPSSVAI